MRSSPHNICCVSLSHALFKELVLESKGVDFNVFLVSPLGNIFILGDIDQIEEIEIEIDEHHVEYTMIDAGDVQRRILFHDDWSDYSILINENGTPCSSTGMTAEDDDDDEWKKTVKYETGQLGQECTSTHDEEDE